MQSVMTWHDCHDHITKSWLDHHLSWPISWKFHGYNRKQTCLSPLSGWKNIMHYGCLWWTAHCTIKHRSTWSYGWRSTRCNNKNGQKKEPTMQNSSHGYKRRTSPLKILHLAFLLKSLVHHYQLKSLVHYQMKSPVYHSQMINQSVYINNKSSIYAR